MKKVCIGKTTLLCIFLIAVINIHSVTAQTVTPLRSQSLNGSTGLFTIPTGRIGWEDTSFGIDFGYRAIINNHRDGAAHIPAVTLSLIRWLEISAAFDIQPDTWEQNNDDFLLGAKLRLINSRNTAVAIGSSFQIINFNNDIGNYNVFQPYLAVTFAGNFFAMPAETTLVFGKTFYSDSNRNNSDIDFGMGFDLVLFPDVFGNTVRWIIDFANFGYSADAWPNYGHGRTPSVWRGIFNTGFRIDLSTMPPFRRLKLNLDFIFNDLFDDGQRSFIIGAVLGFNAGQ